MEESNKPRWRIIGLLGLGTVAATVIALQAKRYLETPQIPDRARSGRELRIDTSDLQRVERGRQLYAQACAACHGAKLEGQPNWRDRLPSGRLPAPPHDASGHTWHHADAILFSLTKNGLVPGVSAPSNYVSDMPAFKSSMSDEDIVAVLAYIKSTWPEKVQAAQREATNEYIGR